MNDGEWIEALALLVLAKDALKNSNGLHTTSTVTILIEEFLAIHCPDEEDPFS